MNKKTAIIIGAGPAGLTAAYELLEKTDIHPVIYELSGDIGGISKSINWKGNWIDIGGHRFFSKSDKVLQWWFNILPLQGAPSRDDLILGRKTPLSKETNAPDPEKMDKVMLIRNRLSRILFLRKLFNYPVSLNWNTIRGLGIVRIIKIGLSYIKSWFFPIREEKSLEDFFINRFGRELYLIFFKDYTEKVWGIPCNRINPEWGAQRVKGLSIAKVVLHILNKILYKKKSLKQKDIETTLIEQFFYPKFGPGQMWNVVAESIKEKGGEIYLNQRVIGLSCEGNKITGIKTKDEKTGELGNITGDYFFSTMPVKELIGALENVVVSKEVREIAEGLMYRDLVSVGLLMKKLKIKNDTRIKTINNIIPDNWIYIQEKDIRVCRIQFYNNWSPYLIKDENTICISLEYFCNEGVGLWSKTDPDLAKFAIEELLKIGFIDKEDVLDYTVIRTLKTYPTYSGSYEKLSVIRKFVDRFENLFLIGRNGMHRYNNMDHSMLTAMTAVDNIVNGIKTKDNIWAVNPEKTLKRKIINP